MELSVLLSKGTWRKETSIYFTDPEPELHTYSSSHTRTPYPFQQYPTFNTTIGEEAGAWSKSQEPHKIEKIEFYAGHAFSYSTSPWPDGWDQVTAICSLLKGTAATWRKTILLGGRTDLMCNYKLFIEEFKKQFEEENYMAKQ